jgi:hypothetical protein
MESGYEYFSEAGGAGEVVLKKLKMKRKLKKTRRNACSRSTTWLEKYVNYNRNFIQPTLEVLSEYLDLHLLVKVNFEKFVIEFL